MVQHPDNHLIPAKLAALRPTQMTVGYREVIEKREHWKTLGKKARSEAIASHWFPAVLGPQKLYYIVDHHHFLAVCYHVGIKKVRVSLIKDLSKKRMTYAQFWKWMFKTRNCYPYCQFGQGPRKALYLPKDIRGVADDPYRSLAWFVRKAGAFENSERNFAEFKWANFFRGKRLLDRRGLAAMSQALVRAVALAQTAEAKRLPGFGKLNLEEKKEAVKKVKKKGHKLAEE